MHIVPLTIKNNVKNKLIIIKVMKNESACMAKVRSYIISCNSSPYECMSYPEV